MPEALINPLKKEITSVSQEKQRENDFLPRMTPLKALVEIPQNLGLNTNEKATSQTLLSMATRNEARLKSFTDFIA